MHVTMKTATMLSGLDTGYAAADRKRSLSLGSSCVASTERSAQHQRSLASKLRPEGLSAQVQDKLQDFGFFRDLEAGTQAALRGIVQRVVIPRGTALFRKGDKPECCYIILAGQVTLSALDWFGSAKGKGDSTSTCSTRASSCVGSGSSSRAVSRGSSRAISAACVADAQAQVIGDAAKKLAIAVNNMEEGEPVCGDPNTLGANIVVLKAGRLFGDVALLQRTPQGFTATCTQDSQLLVIQKVDFEHVLKHDIQRMTGEKLDFLRKYLPGASDLPLHMAEPLLHCFQKKVLPKGRILLSQNVAMKKCLYLVSKGSVFLSCNDVDVPIMPSEVRMLGSLFRGGVFGSMEDGSVQPCTVSCTSASCEVFFVCGRYLEALPSSVKRRTQKYLSQTAEGRLNDENWIVPCTLARPSNIHCNLEFTNAGQPRQQRRASVPAAAGSSAAAAPKLWQQRRASVPGKRLGSQSTLELDTSILRSHTDIGTSPRGPSKKNLGAASLPSLAALSPSEARR